MNVRGPTVCDHCDISELLQLSALASNTFYSSHVALLIPFSATGNLAKKIYSELLLFLCLWGKTAKTGNITT